MAAGFRAFGDDDVDTGLHLPDSMFLRTDQCGHRDALRPRPIDHRLRWHAECVGDELDRMRERHVQQARGYGRQQGHLTLGDARIVEVEGDSVAGEQGLHEFLVALRHAGAQSFDVDAAVAPDHVLGDQDVDAVRPAVHVLVDPLQLQLQLFGRVPAGAEHAEAAGVGYSGDDIAAVTEGEQRKLDTEQVAQWSFHRLDITLRPPVQCRVLLLTFHLWARLPESKSSRSLRSGPRRSAP